MRSARANDRAECARDPTLPTDHLAHVALRDVEMEHERIVALLPFNAHGVGIVDQAAREELDELRNVSPSGSSP